MASPHRVEVTFPAGSAHPASFLKAEWLRCERPQRKIDGFSLGRQAVAPHDRCAGLVVNVHVRACNTPRIHITKIHGSLVGDGGKAPAPRNILRGEPMMLGIGVAKMGVSFWTATSRVGQAQRGGDAGPGGPQVLIAPRVSSHRFAQELARDPSSEWRSASSSPTPLTYGQGSPFRPRSFPSRAVLAGAHPSNERTCGDSCLFNRTE